MGSVSEKKKEAAAVAVRVAAVVGLREANKSHSVSEAVSAVAKKHKVSAATLRVQYYRSLTVAAVAAAVVVTPADPASADTTLGRKELATQVESKVLGGEDVMDALAAVAADADVTVDKVRLAYYYYRSVEVRALHGGSLLTVVQDQALTTAALALDGMLYPPSSADIESLAKSLGLSPEISSDHRWGRRWLKRKQHEGVLSSPRRTKSVSDGRANQQQMLASVEKFSDDWEKHIQHHGVPPAAATINIDETLVVAMEDRVRMQRVTCAGRTRASITGGRGGNTIGSLLAFVNAAGECLLRVFVLKVKPKDGIAELKHVVIPHAEVEGSKRGKVPTCVMYSASGLIDESRYLAIVKVFCDLWAISHGVGTDSSAPATLHAYVFADQLAAHRRRATVEYALAKNVFLWSLPRNTSHITQPLDDAPFAIFKSELRELFALKKQHRLQADMKPKYKELLLEAAWEAATKAFTAKIIKHAFANTHLYPFSAPEFLAHCKRVIGVKISDDVSQLQHRAAEGIVAMFTDAKKTSETEESSVHHVEPSLKVVLTDVHDPLELVQLSKEHVKLVTQQKHTAAMKQEEKAASTRKRKRETEDRAVERLKNTCQHVDKGTGARCKSVHRGGSGWGECALCKAYSLCPKHTSEKQMRHHTIGCFPLDRKKAKKAAPKSKAATAAPMDVV